MSEIGTICTVEALSVGVALSRAFTLLVVGLFVTTPRAPTAPEY